jgi:alkanesulfonate monooxygenase SsuD/methylene tetrahydromethanopterin reductase-like flavin-dependent oxidoreductase (luciferase family)
MPYFVYHIQEPRELEHLGTYAAYREARDKVRELRAAAGPDSVNSVRMIFAKNEAEAIKLLTTPRDERVVGED